MIIKNKIALMLIEIYWAAYYSSGDIPVSK